MNHKQLSARLCAGALSIAFACLTACTTIAVPIGPRPLAEISSAYVENDNYGPGTVSMFTVSSSGTWTPTVPSTIPVGSTPESLIVDPSGRFVYVTGAYDNTVSMFTINSANGLLVPMTPATVPTGGFPQFITVDPTGRFAYTANSSGDTLSMYTIGSTGLLTPTVPATVPAGVEPGCVTVDPTGRFVYASNIPGTVSMYTIDQTTGVLTPTSPATVSIGGDFAFWVTVDPTGHYAYVTENGFNHVYIFAILSRDLRPARPAPCSAAGCGCTPR
jgi:6-phosphogluconolactonase